MSLQEDVGFLLFLLVSSLYFLNRKNIVRLNLFEEETFQLKELNKRLTEEIKQRKRVEKNLLESNLGATPQTDGNNILLKFPELTSERRKELVKLILETAEKFKISIRNIRRKYIDIVKDLEKNKSISIDDSKKYQDDIQKSTDNSIVKIDDNSKQKENENINTTKSKKRAIQIPPEFKFFRAPNKCSGKSSSFS